MKIKNDDNDCEYDVTVGDEGLIRMMKLVKVTMTVGMMTVVMMTVVMVTVVMMAVVMKTVVTMTMMTMTVMMMTVVTMMTALVTSVEYQVDNTSEHPASLPATIMLPQYCKHNTHHIASMKLLA